VCVCVAVGVGFVCVRVFSLVGLLCWWEWWSSGAVEWWSGPMMGPSLGPPWAHDGPKLGLHGLTA
jgi:hypothetical protein